MTYCLQLPHPLEEVHHDGRLSRAAAGLNFRRFFLRSFFGGLEAQLAKILPNGLTKGSGRVVVDPGKFAETVAYQKLLRHICHVMKSYSGSTLSDTD